MKYNVEQVGVAIEFYGGTLNESVKVILLLSKNVRHA